MPPDPGHIPVLADAVLRLLDPRPGLVCLDCTVGRAGHAGVIAPLLAPGGRYIGLDVDLGNVEFARARLGEVAANVKADVVRANFTAARRVLDDLGLNGVDLLLADLGFASTQMADPARGFSFQSDGPLDMRLDPALPQTAADLVNHLPERELADLIFQYGEERLSRRIARKIVEERGLAPINSTVTLARVVRSAYGPRAGSSRTDPATRTFMALRIAVNAELEALQQLLANLPRLIRPGGAAAIISFHSLEDRLVKRAFARLAGDERADLLTRKPIEADEDESRRKPKEPVGEAQGDSGGEWRVMGDG